MRLSRFAGVATTAESSVPAWLPASQRRRLDPLGRLACVAVDRLLAQGPTFAPETAVVVSTNYGAIESTHRFLTSVADFGDRCASPTPFTTSVHNSSAGALGELLGLTGPSTTLSQGGTGTIAALRWAWLLLTADRAPAVLAVIGDRHNDWSRSVVRDLSGSRWLIGDGAAAVLIEPGSGIGRELRLGAHAADTVCDGGGLTDDDETTLATAAAGRRRHIAPDVLGAWWPCCVLASIDEERWRSGEALQLHEAEDGRLERAWLGGWKKGLGAGG